MRRMQKLSMLALTMALGISRGRELPPKGPQAHASERHPSSSRVQSAPLERAILASMCQLWCDSELLRKREGAGRLAEDLPHTVSVSLPVRTEQLQAS